MVTQFVFSPETKDVVLARALRFIDKLKGPWKLSLEPYKPKRSDPQNRYLWGVVYPTIIEKGGLEGWDKDDLHEFFLGKHFGSEIIEGFGSKRHKPLKRSSRLNKQEFADYVDYIQRFAAERGIYIPSPDEVVE